MKTANHWRFCSLGACSPRRGSRAGISIERCAGVQGASRLAPYWRDVEQLVARATATRRPHEAAVLRTAVSRLSEVLLLLKTEGSAHDTN